MVLCMIKKTDIKITKNIWVSHSAYVNYFKRSHNIARLIQVTLPKFQSLLNLQPNLKFRIAPIRCTQTKGLYYPDSKTVVIDCRLYQERAMVTLAHELVHAEQYKDKRLQQRKRKGRWVYFWKGEHTRKKYWDQPWEIEARRRQNKLAREVMMLIAEDMTT